MTIRIRLRKATKLSIYLVSIVSLGIGIAGETQYQQVPDRTPLVLESGHTHSLLPYLKPQALIRKSSLIIEGIVASSEQSRWNEDRTLLFTDYWVLVTDTLKGEPVSEVLVRNPGGIDLETGLSHFVGDAPKLKVGTRTLLALTTENLPFLSMAEGEAYYVTGWSGGAYDFDDTQTLLSNQLHPEFNEPLSHFVARVRAIESGLPDPFPVAGLPLFDTSRGGTLP